MLAAVRTVAVQLMETHYSVFFIYVFPYFMMNHVNACRQGSEGFKKPDSCLLIPSQKSYLLLWNLMTGQFIDSSDMLESN